MVCSILRPHYVICLGDRGRDYPDVSMAVMFSTVFSQWPNLDGGSITKTETSHIPPQHWTCHS